MATVCEILFGDKIASKTSAYLLDVDDRIRLLLRGSLLDPFFFGLKDFPLVSFNTFVGPFFSGLNDFSRADLSVFVKSLFCGLNDFALVDFEPRMGSFFCGLTDFPLDDLLGITSLLPN